MFFLFPCRPTHGYKGRHVCFPGNYNISILISILKFWNPNPNGFIILNFSSQIHLEHQVFVYYGLPSLNVLLLLGSMDAKNSTMIYITCLATRWTWDNGHGQSLAICGRWDNRLSNHDILMICILVCYSYHLRSNLWIFLGIKLYCKLDSNNIW